MKVLVNTGTQETINIRDVLTTDIIVGIVPKGSNKYFLIGTDVVPSCDLYVWRSLRASPCSSIARSLCVRSFRDQLIAGLEFFQRIYVFSSPEEYDEWVKIGG
jgi:hypothetical protein